ncbi:MAG: hypothetical protein WC422_05060 [Candidatus Paceibacterota bacterium]
MQEQITLKSKKADCLLKFTNYLEYKKKVKEEIKNEDTVKYNSVDYSEKPREKDNHYKKPGDFSEALKNYNIYKKKHPEKFKSEPQYENPLKFSQEYKGMPVNIAIARQKEKENQKYKDYLFISAKLKNYNNKAFDSIDICKISNKITKLRVEISKLKEESLNNLNNILTFEKQLNFGLLYLQIFLIILYPLRILILSIKWAFKTIKQKDP